MGNVLRRNTKNNNNNNSKRKTYSKAKFDCKAISAWNLWKPSVLCRINSVSFKRQEDTVMNGTCTVHLMLLLMYCIKVSVYVPQGSKHQECRLCFPGSLWAVVLPCIIFQLSSRSVAKQLLKLYLKCICFKKALQFIK